MFEIIKRAVGGSAADDDRRGDVIFVVLQVSDDARVDSRRTQFARPGALSPVSAAAATRSPHA
jgi:hypothetical protein